MASSSPQAKKDEKRRAGWKRGRLPPVWPVGIAEAERLEQVRAGDVLLPGEVGDGARDLERAVDGAHGEMIPLAGALEHGLGGGVQVAGRGDLPGGERGVAARLGAGAGCTSRFAVAAQLLKACLLARSGGLDARADGAGGLLRRGGGHLAHGNGGDLELHVDAVKQRAGDAPQIPRDFFGRAAAGHGLAAVVAAGLCCAY